MMTLGEHQAAFTRDVAKLILWVDNQDGQRVRLLEAKRTMEQQRWYVEAGVSKTMRSNHLDCLAVDLALDMAGVYQTETRYYVHLGLFWESLSQFNRWGGRYADGNHFERLRHRRREGELQVARWA